MSPRTGTARTFPEQLTLAVQAFEALAGVVPAPGPTATPSVEALLYRIAQAQALIPAPTTAPPAAPRRGRQAHTHPAHRRAGRAAHRRAGKAGRAAA